MSADLENARRRPPRWLWISPVWLIPLGAALVGAWLVYQSLLSRGPEIVLQLEDAEGLEAGQTPVKVRNVPVGTVQALRLSDDYSGAIAEVQMDPDTEPLLVADSKFWVVKPRVGRRGVSGLDTILSGAYIQMRPGDAPEPARRFQVLAQPPVTQPGVPGITIDLLSQGDNSLNVGDPVVYQGQTVGKIEAASFEPTAMRMRYRVFIESPYDELITENTQFWGRSGIEFRVSSEGVRVRAGSLEAILAGGVSFGVIEGMVPGERVGSGADFQLHVSRDAAQQDRFDERIDYVVLFEESVRDLYPGASVEYRGMRVGTVADVPFFSDDFESTLNEDFRIPVRITFEPQRLAPMWADRTLADWRRRLDDLFDRGLRANIKLANLLTGAMFVDLKFTDAGPPEGPERIGDYPVFPSRSGGFVGIEQKVSRLVDKLNDLEIQPLVTDLRGTLDETRGLMANLNALLEDEQTRRLPGDLRAALEEMRRTLKAYQRGEPVYESLDRSLKRLNRVLEDLQPLAETLREHPDALIFGRDAEEDPTPRAAP